VPEGIRNHWSSKIEESVNAADSSWAVREAAIEKALLLGILDSERLSALKNLAFKDPRRYDDLIFELGWLCERIEERRLTLLAAKAHSNETEIAELLQEAEKELFTPRRGERDVFDTLDSKVGCLMDFQTLSPMLSKHLIPEEVDAISRMGIFDRLRAAKTVQAGVFALEALEKSVEEHGGVDQVKTAVVQVVEKCSRLFVGQYLSLPDFGSYSERLQRMLDNREPKTLAQYRGLSDDSFTIDGVRRELEIQSRTNRVLWRRED